MQTNDTACIIRFEVPALGGQEGLICVDGTAEVVPGRQGKASRLKVAFTSFKLVLGGQER
jgi:hypothetical protein